MNLKRGAYLLALVSLVIFIVVAFNFNTTSFVAFDEWIISLLRGNGFIILFHYLGETKFIIMVAVILMVYCWIREKNYRGMLFVLFTIGVGNGVNQLLKYYFARPRPEIENQLATFSFPSGHSQLSVLYLLTMAYLISEMTTSSKKVMIVWLAAILLSFFIGLSRIAEGRHFPTDVLAGWSIGYTWFIICVLWYESRKRKYQL